MINNDTKFFDLIFKNQKIKHILLLGDTTNPEKFAHKIMTCLLDQHYEVYCVDKQYQSISAISSHFDAVVLCMHPIKCLNLITKDLSRLKNVIIQPGAESDDISLVLTQAKIKYTHGCVLKYFKVNVI